MNITCYEGPVLCKPIWPSDAMFSGGIRGYRSRSALLDGTKPLPETMLTYHQRCSMAFTSPQFPKKCYWTQSVTCVRSHFLSYIIFKMVFHSVSCHRPQWSRYLSIFPRLRRSGSDAYFMRICYLYYRLYNNIVIDIWKWFAHSINVRHMTNIPSHMHQLN